MSGGPKDGHVHSSQVPTTGQVEKPREGARSGLKSSKALGPSSYAWSAMEGTGPSAQTFLSPGSDFSKPWWVGLWKGLLCSWFSENLPLIPTAHQRKQNFSVWHLRPSAIPSCRSVWPLVCEPQALVRCLDPYHQKCPLPILRPPPTWHFLPELPATPQSDELTACPWYSHRRASLRALNNFLE